MQAYLKTNLEHEPLEDFELPDPVVQAVPIWKRIPASTRKIPKDHPFCRLKQAKDERAVCNYYLYWLFYHREFVKTSTTLRNFMGKSGSEITPVLKEIDTADQLPLFHRRQFDKIIYLGCVLSRRCLGESGEREFCVYFCPQPSHRNSAKNG
ncbi:MAG: hypothetical protein HY735_27840 [Verrucomicrobia bacterium]|nr:hypothetical protein [Verrucomicrobiota bacterium]